MTILVLLKCQVIVRVKLARSVNSLKFCSDVIETLILGHPIFELGLNHNGLTLLKIT